MKRLSPAMLAALRSVRDTGHAGSHLRGQSQHGGFGQVIVALKKRGLMVRGATNSDPDTLTPAGLAALEVRK